MLFLSFVKLRDNKMYIKPTEEKSLSEQYVKKQERRVSSSVLKLIFIGMIHTT